MSNTSNAPKTPVKRPRTTAAKTTAPKSSTSSAPATSSTPLAPGQSASSTTSAGAYQPVNVYAAVSLAAGVAALFGLAIPGAPIAIILGHVALSGIRRNGERGRGSAIFGLVVGYVTLVGWLIFFLVAGVALITAIAQFPQMVSDAATGAVQDSLGGMTEGMLP